MNPADARWVRIVDPDDRYARRLGVILGQDDETLSLWIGGHDPKFRHNVRRDQTEPVTGTWIETNGGDGYFMIDRASN